MKTQHSKLDHSKSDFFFFQLERFGIKTNFSEVLFYSEALCSHHLNAMCVL